MHCEVPRSENRSPGLSFPALNLELLNKDTVYKAGNRDLIQSIFNRRILRSVPCMWYKPLANTTMSTDEFPNKRNGYVVVYFHGNGEDLISTINFCKHLSILLQVALGKLDERIGSGVPRLQHL